MKKIFGFLALGLLLAVSCEKEGPMTVNHITDLYTAPDGATVMQLSKAESQWATDRRYFNLNFGTLSTTLVGYDALLAPGQYLIGADQIGSAINTKVNGQTPGKGWITVNEKDGQYQITATFDDKVYYWTGTLPFTPDPAPTKLVEVLSAQSNKGNGVNSLTMNLSTGGFSQGYDENWQQVWTGAGNYLALDIYSDDGYLHDGTYKASAQGGVINPNEFGIGYDTVIEYTDWEGNPQTYEAKDWGTCWWTVADGAATAEKISSGIVTVTSREEKVDDKDVTIWTIAWGAKYPVEVVFEGAIPALTKPKKPDGPAKLDYNYIDTVTPGDAIDTHAIVITDKDGNEAAYLELLTEPGAADLTGAYPATSYAGEPGQMRDGYYIDAGEYGIFSGGSYYVEGGEKKYIGAGTATVEVTKVAEGAYRFTCEFFDYAAAGPDYVPGGEGGDEGVVLTQFTSLIDYAMFGMNMVGIEMATDGVIATAGGWGKTYSGDGQYLKLEIYAEGGNIEPGVYTPCAEGAGGTLKAFEFNIGYDSSGNPYGSNWFTLTGGASSNEYITDGTVTITGSGEEYTVVLDCSVAKAKYVGPLHE